VINEVLSRNSSGIEDEDGDSSDWIELFNASNQSVSLEGYGLSDDPSDPLKWIFPARSIAAGEFILIYASGKDRLSTQLHSNFRISGDGEPLLLSSFDGSRLDEVLVPALEENEAYARRTNGAQQWTKTPFLTPGSSNIGNELVFSHAEGFYESDFELSIQGSFGDTIYFTRDGSIPTQFDEVYNSSLSITSRAGDPNVFSEIVTTPNLQDPIHQTWVSPMTELHKGNVLRFASYGDGYRSSPIYTKTYFTDGLLSDRYTTPVVSLVCDSSSLFGHDTGIYIPGVNFDPSNPVWTGNYTKRGSSWERDAHIAYFDHDGKSVINQNLGIRIHGGKTRNVAQKSIRLYARSEYGKRKFKYQFFKGRNHTDYKRLVLRSSAGSWGGPTIINDALAHSIVEKLDFESQKTQPVTVYLNGEYWGLYTLIDRVDERYVEYETGIESDSVDLWDWLPSQDFPALVNYVEAKDLSVEANYNYVASRVDIDNFIDYNIAQQFFANVDWPANNNSQWRLNTSGKWRWIFYDLDAGFNFTHKNMFEHMMFEPTPDGSYHPDVFASALYRNLLDNDQFVKKYVSRFSELLSTTFSTNSTMSKLLEIEASYQPEMELHASRWSYPSSEGQWSSLVRERIGSFLVERPCIVYEQMVSFFNLDKSLFACDTDVFTNEITIFPNPSNGVLQIENDSPNLLLITHIEIFNILGQTVLKDSGETLPAGGRHQIDLGEVVNGVYILTFKAGSEIIEKKIVLRSN